jgi:N-acetylmuramoyl-L-alanine amidase
MRSYLLTILAAATAAVSPTVAQEQNSEIIQVSPDMFLRWHGHAYRTYFVQISDPNDHLRKWIWAPIIETGNDEDISYEVDGTADKGFFRLWFSDQATTDPDGDDFDRDGLTNLDEVTLYQTNPLDSDTDGDGLLDGWEVANSLDPNDDGTTNVNNGGSGDPDNDGLTNAEEQDLGTDPSDGDSDDDGITDGGEDDQGTDPNDPEDTPDAEWFILTGDLEEDAVKKRSRTVTIPAGESRVITVVVASDEYPDWTGDESKFNDTLEWNIQPSEGDALEGSIDVNARHDEWEEAEIEGRECKGFSPAHVETGMTLTAPDNAALTVEIELSATNIGDGTLPSTVLVGILPVVPVEFFPQLLDGDDVATAGSENPRTEPGQTNGMTEEDPVANRTAHREIHMRIDDGEILEGKQLTWSMAPLFVPPAGGDPVFRGDWANSTTHPNRYETAVHFGANGFEAVDQATAHTDIDEDGESAIRTNLAPVGFNKGRLRVAVEDFQGDPAKVADMEVPAIVVIDPGHGGTTNLPGSSANNATSPTGVLEKDLALTYGLALRTVLEAEADSEDLQLVVPMTRNTDNNVSGTARANYVRDRGADIVFVIHFNASTAHTARGKLEVRQVPSQVNLAEDIALIDPIIDRIVAAMTPFDEGANKRTAVETDTSVAFDPKLGNTAEYHPIRAGYCEVEFLDNADVDELFNTGEETEEVRTAIVEAIRDGILLDLRTQPNP